MATSKCGGCGGSTFELKENEPRGSNYKLLFVQCASCGVVAGVTEFFNIGSKLQKIEAGLKKAGIRID